MRQAGSTRSDCNIQTCSIPLTKEKPEAHPVGQDAACSFPFMLFKLLCASIFSRTSLSMKNRSASTKTHVRRESAAFQFPARPSSERRGNTALGCSWRELAIGNGHKEQIHGRTGETR